MKEYFEQEDGDRLGITVNGLHVYLGDSTDPKDEIDPSMFTLTRSGVKLHPPAKAAVERNLKLLEADRIRRLPLKTSLTMEDPKVNIVVAEKPRDKKGLLPHLKFNRRKFTSTK